MWARNLIPAPFSRPRFFAFDERSVDELVDSFEKEIRVRVKLREELVRQAMKQGE